MGFLFDWLGLGSPDEKYGNPAVSKAGLEEMLPVLQGKVHPDDFVKTCKDEKARFAVKDTLYHFRFELMCGMGDQFGDPTDPRYNWYYTKVGKRQLPGDVRQDLYATYKHDIGVHWPHKYKWSESKRRLLLNR